MIKKLRPLTTKQFIKRYPNVWECLGGADLQLGEINVPGNAWPWMACIIENNRPVRYYVPMSGWYPIDHYVTTDEVI